MCNLKLNIILFEFNEIWTTLKVHRYVLLPNRCIESDHFCEYASSCHITNVNKPIQNATLYRDTCMVTGMYSSLFDFNSEG